MSQASCNGLIPQLDATIDLTLPTGEGVVRLGSLIPADLPLQECRQAFLLQSPTSACDLDYTPSRYRNAKLIAVCSVSDLYQWPQSNGCTYVSWVL